jgi:hypothetical protein
MAQDYKGNPDSAGLGCFGDDRFTVGYIDEVNGPGAVEVPAFVPTRHELIQLAKYWAGVEIDLEFSWFVYQATGSSEIRRGPFASRRIARIAEALGEEAVAEAVRQAYNEFAKGIDPRTWSIFLNGTPEERRVLQDELAREAEGGRRNGNRSSHRTHEVSGRGLPSGRERECSSVCHTPLQCRVGH